MWVKIYRESGYAEAAHAARLSRGALDNLDSHGDDVGPNDMDLFIRLLKADSTTAGQPHSVALRQIVYWLGVNAPLYWWKHMDRYTVGKTQASASTMYGILKRDLTDRDFDGTIFPEYIEWLNKKISEKDFDTVNRYLPQAYLQERSLMIALPALRNILTQRSGHKLVEWRIFIEEVIAQAKYPQLLLC